MARVLLAAVFMTVWFTVGFGLFDSNFSDWKIYVVGAVGGIGFVFVNEWNQVRRLIRNFAKPS